MTGEQDRQREVESLPPELLILLDAFRSEIDARFTSIKLWGALALLGGGTIGGLVSKLVAPSQTQAAYTAVVHFFT